ncbi:MAG: flippase-like domain-containing protein [Proteobacteria bacterium]|nr:flippase-like domain-containing protein [Pseudomonadota bacterium]MBI3497207.1 flippase-like domain-containing protein [Pseudomonadota bacterium]
MHLRQLIDRPIASASPMAQGAAPRHSTLEDAGHRAREASDLGLGRAQFRRAARWVLANLVLLLAIAVAAAALLDAPTWKSLDTALHSSGIAAAATATIIAMSLNVARWLVLWRTELGRGPIAVQALFYVSGYAMSATPGRAGELIRLWFNRRHFGVSYLRSLPVFVLDRVADTTSVVVCGVVGFAIINQSFEVLLPFGIFSTIALCVLGFPRPWLALIRGLRVRLSGRFRMGAGLLRVAALTLARTARLYRRPAFMPALLLAIASRVVQCIGLSLVLASAEQDVSLALALTAYSAGSLAGAASFLPAGLGAAELAIIATLAAYGLPAAPVVASVIVFRVGGFWLATLIGLAALSTALALVRLRKDTSISPCLPLREINVAS